MNLLEAAWGAWMGERRPAWLHGHSPSCEAQQGCTRVWIMLCAEDCPRLEAARKRGLGLANKFDWD